MNNDYVLAGIAFLTIPASILLAGWLNGLISSLGY